MESYTGLECQHKDTQKFPRYIGKCVAESEYLLRTICLFDNNTWEFKDNVERIFISDDNLLDSIGVYLQSKYTNDDIVEMCDDTIPSYVDADWEESGDYDSEYEWYCDHNSGDAEYHVKQELFDEVNDEFIIDDSLEDRVLQLIAELYPKLDY